MDVMRRLACLLLPPLLAAGCDRAPRVDQAELAKGQHLTHPFTAPGRCFGKPSKCVSDAQCAPPFSLCQEGTCCSGELDPATCECRCGSGPACGSGELCCAPPEDQVQAPSPEGQPGQWEERAPKDHELRCRPVRECFSEG